MIVTAMATLLAALLADQEQAPPPGISADRLQRLRELAQLSEEEIYRVPTAELDRAVWGFTTGDILRVPLDQIDIIYPGDLELAKDRIPSKAVARVWRGALQEPIELKFKAGRFLIQDGHHRYTTARRLGHTDILAVITPDDNPIVALEQIKASTGI